MTNKKVQPALIGVFVTLSCLLFVIAVIIFGGSRFFDKENVVIAYFEGSLKGLSIGAPVTYRGVTVGKVKEIKIYVENDEHNQHQVIIPVLIALSAGSSISVDSGEGDYDGSPYVFLEAMCKQGLRAKLKLQSMVTGQRYIDLAVYENSPAIYRDKGDTYLEIPTLPSETQQVTRILENMDFDEMFNRVNNIFASLDQLSGNLAASVDVEMIKKLMTELSKSVTSLNSILAKVDSGATPVFENMNSSLKDIDALTRHADELVSSFDSNLPPLMEEMTATVANFNATIEKAQQLIDQAGRTIKPTSPIYHRISEAMLQLEKTAASVENLSELLYRNPNALILGVQQTGDNGHE
ncbi:MAG: MlaD family protein [Thermodesulfobacteriota bacterium]